MAEVRILSHMNKDHRVSIEDYLVVYGAVKLDSKVHNIKMTHIELTHMTITFEHDDLEFPVEKLIPFEPAMEDLKEARTRLVEMAKFAAEKRGFDAHQITDFKKLSIGSWFFLAFIYLPFWCYLWPSLLQNSTVLSVLSQSQADWLLTNSLNITYLTLGLHAIECYLFMKKNLEYYRVPIDNQIEWYIDCLFEGYPSVKRFKQHVADKLNH
ncbi:CYFA0S27e00738g1_1 [Cyberlindnera fabianii]|uniref:CYFA0S27e00738g1_1 n=1 Tax=Cyberlindnera fabianii TaxID=36022 RepID=A0A061BJ53_CYBFA|nr:CYFA0S27e00738g1_1 [Cyberlindnera fabianii]